MWRLLEEGEITQEGDEYFEYHLSAHGTWVAVGKLTQGLPFLKHVGHPVRRKISQTEERNDSAELAKKIMEYLLNETGVLTHCTISRRREIKQGINITIANSLACGENNKQSESLLCGKCREDYVHAENSNGKKVCFGCGDLLE